MRQITLDGTFEEYDSFDELPADDRQLMMEARKAAGDAYAPYSHFHVGAAVQLENGTIVRGNNQENAAYPSGLCAERVAFFSIGAQYPNQKIKSVAITALPEGSLSLTVAISPCGDCRQVMAEYEYRYGQPIRIIMDAGNGKYIASPSVRLLLPFLFTADSMK